MNTASTGSVNKISSGIKSLTEVLAILKAGIGTMPEKYFIPEAWNTWGYERFSRVPERNGEIMVDPYDFYADCIVNGILAFAADKANRRCSGHESSHTQQTDPCNIRRQRTCPGNARYQADPARAAIYSLLIRAATAWDHYERGRLLPGTFLKAMCLLPYLRRLGTTVVYLLPVFKRSDRYRKGEIGSPYSIKNIYMIDADLHDPLLGDYSETMLDTEFRAFSQACRLLGMRVMVDFAFRTVSRDSDLIAEHPDWFYWIDAKEAASFTAPVVGKSRRPLPMNDSTVERLYRMKGTKEYLGKFVHPPDRTDPEKWKMLKERHYRTGENILDLIEDAFGITTMPGFSDVINDSQPPWTDITYLRYYFDVNEKTEKYISPDQPPYLMQDGVCLRLYPGRAENTGLKEYICGVIPYYQDKYGIDGARIDMGHALTPDLNREIIRRAKEKNSAFIFWSEEFDPGKSEEAKNNGFHFINGMVWSIYKDIDKKRFNKKLIKDLLMKSRLPVIASPETPDTPRAAWVFRDRKRLRQLIFINCFLPNSVQFINNGFDLMEVQPMNLGLDNSEQGRYVLDEDDPMYGKLAFFDNYRMHWLNEGRQWIREQLTKSAELRNRYLDIICDKENFVINSLTYRNSMVTTLLYYDRKDAGGSNCRGVFLLANRDTGKAASVRIKQLLEGTDEISAGSGTTSAGQDSVLPAHSSKQPASSATAAAGPLRSVRKSVRVVYSTGHDAQDGEAGTEYPGSRQAGIEIRKGEIHLDPGEVIIGEVCHEEA